MGHGKARKQADIGGKLINKSHFQLFNTTLNPKSHLSLPLYHSPYPDISLRGRMATSLDLMHKRVSGETKEEDFLSPLFFGPGCQEFGSHHSKYHKGKKN